MKRLDRRELILSTVATSLIPLQAIAAETPLACNLKALSAEERRAHKERSERLFKSAKVSPLETGYAVSWPASSWLDSAAWVDLERKCCPFLHFQLESAAESGNVVLRLTGRPGVKAFLAEELRLGK